MPAASGAGRGTAVPPLNARRRRAPATHKQRVTLGEELAPATSSHKLRAIREVGEVARRSAASARRASRCGK
eukprot:14520190-Alexandrium_andersonii.AAC.1